MHVVFVASEAVPFAKTGGLADVTVFLPSYRRARSTGLDLLEIGLNVVIPVGERTVRGRVLEGRLPGSRVPVYLIDQPGYFDREGLYGNGVADYDDNCERFVFFRSRRAGDDPSTPAPARDGRGVWREAAGVRVAVIRDGENVVALSGRCPHAGGPLGLGWIEEGEAVCPLHRWRFRLADGRCTTMRGYPVHRFRCEVRGDEVWVEV